VKKKRKRKRETERWRSGVIRESKQMKLELDCKENGLEWVRGGQISCLTASIIRVLVVGCLSVVIHLSLSLSLLLSSFLSSFLSFFLYLCFRILSTPYFPLICSSSLSYSVLSSHLVACLSSTSV